MDIKKTFVILFLAIFLISFASAWDGDNTYEYFEEIDTAVIHNCDFWIGWCWNEGEVLAELTLTSGDTIVHRGEDVLVGKFNYTPYTNDTTALEGMGLTNMKNGQSMVRGGQFKIKEIEEIEIIDFYDDCNDVWNETNQSNTTTCERIENGSHIENKTNWKPISNPHLIFNIGETYEIGVFVDVEEGDYGDWQPDVMGIRVSEWSTWTESLNVGLQSYYKLDDDLATTIVIDSLGINNGTLLGGDNTEDLSTTGLINLSLHFNGIDDRVDLGASVIPTGTSDDLGISVWINPDAIGANLLFIGQKHPTASNPGRFLFYINTGGTITFSLNGATPIVGTTVLSASGGWYNVVATRDSSDVINLYLNGKLEGTTTSSQAFEAVNTVIGSDLVPELYFDGQIDEVAFYNRSLTDGGCSVGNTCGGEIAQFYNNRTGITYSAEVIPEVNIIYPTNTTYNDFVSELNYTNSSDATDCWFSKDGGATNSTPISCGTNFTTTSVGGTNTWTVYANNTEGNIGSDSVTFFVNTGVGTALITPPQSSNFTNGYTNFTFSSTPLLTNLTNATMYLWYENETLVLTNFTTLSGESTIQTTFFSNLAEGNYKWNAETCGEGVDCSFASSNNSFIVHLTEPEILLFEPNETFSFLAENQSMNLSWQIVEPGRNLSEHITNCSYDYNGVTTYIDINTCVNINTTTFNYSQGVNNLTFTAVDEFGLSHINSTSWNVIIANYTTGADYEIVGEGTDVTFNLTLNYLLPHTSTARLHINGFSYIPDNIITISGTNFYEKTVNMADGFGNATGNTLEWYWVYNMTDIGDSINTTSKNITIYAVEIDDCSSYGELILNLTLADEETLSILPGANESSNVEVDLTISGIDNASIMWRYWNTYTNESNPQVCIPLNILNYSSYKIDFTIGFDSTDRVQEFYYLDNGTLDNSKQFNSYTDISIGLYDLLTVDSTTFLFNFFDKDGLGVDNAIVHTFRRYIGDGEFLEVERSKQDNNGETHNHLVEEDVIYRFMITQNGIIIFTSEEYNALCETLPCTIALSETGEFEQLPDDYSLINGTDIIINNATTRISTYVYSMSSPGNVEFTLYKQNYDGTSEEIDSDSSTSSSGTLSVSIPLHAGNVSYYTAIHKNDEFVKSQWVDLNDMDASTYFGVFLSVFIAFLIVVTLVLIFNAEKSGVVIAFILGLIFTSALGLTRLQTATGQNLIIYVIVAGGVLVFKLAKKKRF